MRGVLHQKPQHCQNCFTIVARDDIVRPSKNTHKSPSMHLLSWFHRLYSLRASAGWYVSATTPVLNTLASQSQPLVLAAFLEETLSFPDHKRMDQQSILINEIMPHQQIDQ